MPERRRRIGVAEPLLSRVDVQAADAPVGVEGGDPHLAPGHLEPAVEEAGEGETLDAYRLASLPDRLPKRC